MSNNINIDKNYIELMRNLNEELYNSTGHQRLAFTHSYGCQQNVADGEKINGQLAEMGFGFANDREDADFILYNTCAVREHAEDRVFGNVGALKHLKRRKPELIVGLCGCMTQQEQVVERIKKSYPFVDLIFGTHALHKIPELVYKSYTQSKKVIDISEDNISITEGIPVRRDNKYKAWISIMYGCNNFCTYCIVPYVRGRERSRKSEDILSEIKSLVSKGYKDFTLLGQNVNSYGNNLEEEINFSELLRKIQEIEGDFRVSFMSSHPKDATKELIDTIRDCDKISRHIHLPVQSGSNRILKAMNRNYTVEKYKEIIQYAKENIPNVTFTSDIIVGFPGEEYSDFCQTLDLIKEVKYNALYTFIYSKRSGTNAAKLDDPIPYEEKAKWMQELLKIQDPIGRGINKSRIGKIVRVLAENIGQNGDGWISGKTDSNMVCEFKGSQDLIGKFSEVEVCDSANWALYGNIK